MSLINEDIHSLGVWNIFVERDFMRRGFNLYARARGPYGAIFLKSVMIETEPETEENVALAYPQVRLPEDVAQKLMDALWNAGLRPNDGEGTMAHTSVLREFVEFLKTQNTQLLDKALE